MMKKIRIVLSLLLVSIASSLITACSIFSNTKYKVTFYNDDTIYLSITVNDGQVVGEPTNPQKDGYDFDAWYTTNTYEYKYDFSNVVKSNLNLYAKWNIKSNNDNETPVEKYSITYVTEYGITPSQEENVTTLPTTLPTLTYNGYTFNGWYLDENYSIKAIAGSTITSNITLYAKWELNESGNENNPVEKYSITYVTEYGITPSQEENVITLPTTLPTLTYTGYTFNGWYLDSNLTTKAVAGTSINDNTILYASWTINTYTVVFNSNGGSEVNSQTVNYNNSLTIPTNPIKSGYIFEGWYTDNELTDLYDFEALVNSSFTLYAKWELDESSGDNDNSDSSIIFSEDFSTTTVDDLTYVAGSSDNASISNGILTVEGGSSSLKPQVKFLFDAQSDGSIEITFNLSLGTDSTNWGAFEILNSSNSKILDLRCSNKKVLGFRIDGTTTPEMVSDFEFNSNTTYSFKFVLDYYDDYATITAYVLVDESYILVMDCTEFTLGAVSALTFGLGNNSNKSVSVSNILVIKADSTTSDENKLYNISYFTELGDAPTSISNVTALPTTLPTLTYTGYTFNGWYLDRNLTTKAVAGTSINANIILYASWTINTYTVVFNSDGGSEVNSQTVNYNNKVSIPTNPTKSGYTFEGWYSDSELTELYDFDSLVNSSFTLYAKWELNESGNENNPVEKYSITYVTEYGITPSQEENVTTLPTTLPTLTYNGYTFNGWYLDSNFTTKAVAGTSINANTILYASWTINTYTVVFNSDGGSEVNSQTVNYNNKVSIPTNPTKSGYTFEGWYSDSELTELYDFDLLVNSSFTLYARWEKNISYTINFNSNGGSSVESQTIEEGYRVIEPNDPSKDDYTFTGWYTDIGCTKLYNFNSTVSNSFTLYAGWTKTTDTISITSYSGYDEGAYVEWSDVDASSACVTYQVDVDGASWITVDNDLIRQIDSSTARVDIVGLSTGVYNICVTSSNHVSRTLNKIDVYEQDRSGYAHFNNSTGVGAYNDDGTLKDDAIVVYVTDETKNTVTATINKKTYTGLSAILQAQTSASSPIPLDIRIIGTINAATWNSATYGSSKDANGNNLPESTLTESEIIAAGYNDMTDDINAGITKLNGLTNKIKWDGSEHDSYYNMLDINYSQYITVEGIGTDAMLFQWGFTWKNCSYIEVKNLTFDDYTEDACSFEGSDQKATTLSGFSTGHIWLHNNTFNEGNNKWDVCSEQDKHEGDGACDFKGNAYITVAYNHFIKNHKTGLVGANDSSYTANITFHHNYYEKCVSRMPLGRNANMHMYNNYYYGSTGTNMSLRGTAYSLLENCYFESANSPVELKNSAVAKAYGCVFNNCTKTNSATVVNSRTESVSNSNKFGTDFDTNSSLFYYDNTNKCSDVMYITDAEQAKADCIKYSGVLKSGTYVSPGGSLTKYTVTFETNGGSSVSDQTVSEGNTLSIVSSTKSGYKLVGWYTDSKLTNLFDFSTAVMSNMTLYAKWSEVVYYTVTYETNSSTTVNAQTVEIGDYISAPTVKNSGYKLVGWYIDSSFKTEFNFNTTPVTSNLTLYAKWEEFSFETMILDLDDLTSGTSYTEETLLNNEFYATNNTSIKSNSIGKYVYLSGQGSTSSKAIIAKTGTTDELSLTVTVSGGGSDRYLLIADSNGNVVGSITVTGGETVTETITISGSQTYYIYSKGSGLNIYSLSISA